MGGQRVVSWVGVIAGLGVLVGILSAVLWARVVHLPAYVVGEDHLATMTEHGHVELFAADVWFVIIGLTGGLVLGVLAWSWFRGLGWPAGLIAMGTGLLSGLVCAGAGQLLGPGSFEARLAHANPGDSVPVAFQLHSPAVLAVWGLAAVAPVFFASALGPEQVADGREAGLRGRARPVPPAEPEHELPQIDTGSALS